jgi:hypothetical protein
MADNPFTTSATTPPLVSAAPAALDYAAIARSDPQIISGARWFWWIAGLSLVNTVLIHSGSDTSFVIGLGFTLVADAIFQAIKPIAFAIDALALGFFFAMGWFAGKGRLWAFLVGIVCYVLDAGIYLFFQDWMSLAFHALALVYLAKATISLRGAIQAAKFAVKAPTPAPVAAG